MIDANPASGRQFARQRLDIADTLIDDVDSEVRIGSFTAVDVETWRRRRAPSWTARRRTI